MNINSEIKNNKRPCLYKENNADKIISRLWIGNLKSSQDMEFLRRNNITHIIRLYQDLIPESNYKSTPYGYVYDDKGIIIYHFPIKDVDFSGRNMSGFFSITNMIINNLINKNKNVLVHCKNGHHRSGVVICAYLIKINNYNYEEAIKKINTKRNCSLRRWTHMSEGLFKYIYPNSKTVECHNKNKYFICSSLLKN